MTGLLALLPRKGTWLVFGLALLVRVLVVGWAAGRVAPAADGKFYHVVAQRIAAGDGYTWLWPDGAVTYAAHYPVGYPGLLGLTYWLCGPSVVLAMLMNALLGALGAAAMCGVAREAVGRSPFPAWQDRASLVAGLSVALLPSLVLYVPALMTEGAVGAVGALAMRTAIALGSSASPARRGMRPMGWLLLGLLLGGAALLRPQSILLAPVMGWVAGASRRLSWRAPAGALLASVLALAVCAPWTWRNCVRMERCLFVSANGGWNLLIGTFPEGEGAWLAVEGERVPEDCRTVFQEAAKDRCFGQAGRRRILEDPTGWLRLLSAKWAQTFDYTAAATQHLREAGALSESGSRFLAGLELVSQRLLHGLGALGLGWWAARKRASRLGALILLLGSLLGFGGLSAPLGWLCLLGLAALSGAWRASAGVFFACAAVLLTGVVHGVFFGAGRYALPLSLWAAPLTALGVASLNVLTVREQAGDTSRHGSH